MPAGPDARRYFVLDVGGNQKNNWDYFARIIEDLENGGYENLLHYLQNVDLTGFNVTKIPHSDALIDQKQRSMSSADQWIFDVLDEGSFRQGGKWKCEVPRKAVQSSYHTFVERQRETRRMSDTHLGRYLNELFDVGNSRPRGKGTLLRFWVAGPNAREV